MLDAFCVARAEEAARIEVTANVLATGFYEKRGFSHLHEAQTRFGPANECGISSATTINKGLCSSGSGLPVEGVGYSASAMRLIAAAMLSGMPPPPCPASSMMCSSLPRQAL
jgi:hypothetical protein